MLEDLKIQIFIGLILLGVGVAIGHYFVPTRTEVRTVTQTQEVVHHDVQTIIKEVVRPDGTKETDTVITDHSKDEKESLNKTEKIVDNQKPQWKVNAQFLPQNVSTGYVYGVSVERRIIGPIFAGAFVNTDRNVGLTAGLEF